VNTRLDPDGPENQAMTRDNAIAAQVAAYLAEIGRKGGRASGECKRRSPEHYRRMVEARRAKSN